MARNIDLMNHNFELLDTLGRRSFSNYPKNINSNIKNKNVNNIEHKIIINKSNNEKKNGNHDFHQKFEYFSGQKISDTEQRKNHQVNFSNLG